MWSNVKFRIELSKTNPGLAKLALQQKTCGYVQKLLSSIIVVKNEKLTL